jgi:hypothetical protein
MPECCLKTGSPVQVIYLIHHLLEVSSPEFQLSAAKFQGHARKMKSESLFTWIPSEATDYFKSLIFVDFCLMIEARRLTRRVIVQSDLLSAIESAGL